MVKQARLATIGVINKANPKWKITYAGNWHPELSELLDDYCMIVDHSIPEQALPKRKQNAQTTTFYVCCVPARPNNFSFSPPAESTWMGWHTAARGYDGFLRWAKACLTRLTREAFDTSEASIRR
jgi:hypothetical protein